MQALNPIAALLLTTSLLASSLLATSNASAEPASPTPAPMVSDRPEVIESETSVKWVPLARINQAKPVTIELRNKTAEPLEYLITTHTDFRILAPGATVNLIVSDFPTFVNVNAQRSVGVKYGLNVEGNMIKVDLNLTAGQGDTTLNIHELGAVYLY
jgi:hypothetical protein